MGPLPLMVGLGLRRDRLREHRWLLRYLRTRATMPFVVLGGDLYYIGTSVDLWKRRPQGYLGIRPEWARRLSAAGPGAGAER